jgi:ABC-type bacteriocin/lantibiotic exporter with double-glycine peptidase domain
LVVRELPRRGAGERRLEVRTGPLFLGGWLVLKGRSDVGTVVASLTGLTRIEGPWRDLVSFFRTASTVRVKHEMLVHAIAPRP